MSSDMPDRYIDREGITEDEVIDAVKVDEITKYKKENQKLMEERIKVREEMESLKQEVSVRNQVIAKVSNPRNVKAMYDFLRKGRHKFQKADVEYGRRSIVIR